MTAAAERLGQRRQDRNICLVRAFGNMSILMVTCICVAKPQTDSDSSGSEKYPRILQLAIGNCQENFHDFSRRGKKSFPLPLLLAIAN